MSVGYFVIKNFFLVLGYGTNVCNYWDKLKVTGRKFVVYYQTTTANINNDNRNSDDQLIKSNFLLKYQSMMFQLCC